MKARPQGIPGLVPVASPFRPTVSLDDCLVNRLKPWLLEIWEPLRTKAPAPPKASPHCCYIRTVIFYCSPHVVRPWTRIYRGSGGRLRWCSPGFEQWDEVETRLAWDDRVTFKGELFEITGGTVVWSRRRWWMRRGARRVVDAVRFVA